MMQGKKGNNKQTPKQGGGRRGSSSSSLTDADGNSMDIQKLLKDIEYLGSSCMTWKERKELENRRVVSLGGKPLKKQRMPLSVAKVSMKKQKEREEKMLQEGLVLGCFGGKLGTGTTRAPEKRKAEDKVLKSIEGHFSKGVLDVKHMLRQRPSQDNRSKPLDIGNLGMGKKKKAGEKKKGKKGKRKGGKKRR